MIMKKIAIILIFIFFAGSSAAKQVKFAADGAFFRQGDNKCRWEFYYSFPDTLPRYVNYNGKFSAELKIDLVISNSVREIVNTSWNVIKHTDSVKNEFEMNLVGQKNFILSPGQYSVKLTVTDLNDHSTKATKSFSIIAPDFPENKIAQSDIELAQLIEKEKDAGDNWLNTFYKNTLYVLPNPQLEYYGESPSLLAYMEIYNAKSVAPEGYTVKKILMDALYREIVEIPASKKSESDGLVEIIEIPLNILSTGVYYLKTIVTHEKDGITDSATAMKKFYYLNSEMPPDLEAKFMESAKFESSEFATMSYDRVQKEFLKASYIATENEKQQWDMLQTLKSQQRFLFTFWKNRDPKPKTKINERLRDYRKAEEYANTYFTYGMMKEGWRTDRGRILLKYGFPSDREKTFPNASERAYENWRYDNVQGGVNFYFVDMGGFNDFKLVHSTARGEVYNPNWYDLYVPAIKEKSIDSPTPSILTQPR